MSARKNNTPRCDRLLHPVPPRPEPPGDRGHSPDLPQHGWQYFRRAWEAGVSWPLPDELDDRRLEAALYPPTPPSRVPRPEPDWAELLWLEYRRE